MKFLDAAFTVLEAANEALHYEEITERALQRNLLSTTGKTPEATMGSRLYTDTLQEGSRFARVGKGFFELAKVKQRDINARVQEINNKTRQELRERLHSMPPNDFEEFIKDLLIQLGFKEETVITTPYVKDGGIDVKGVFRAAGLTDVNAAVQVKRWKGSVGSKEVTQLRGSLVVEQQGIIITTGGFTKAAIEEANAPGKQRISLINGEELVNLLVENKVGVIEKKFATISLDEERWGQLAETHEEVEEVVPRKVPQQVKLQPQANIVSAKPQFLILDDEKHTVSSWKEVLVVTCSYLAKRYASEFEQRVTEIRGRKRNYFGRSESEMTAPARIPGTELFVETNASASQIQKLLKQVMDSLGHDPATIQIVERGSNQ